MNNLMLVAFTLPDIPDWMMASALLVLTVLVTTRAILGRSLAFAAVAVLFSRGTFFTFAKLSNDPTLANLVDRDYVRMPLYIIAAGLLIYENIWIYRIRRIESSNPKLKGRLLFDPYSKARWIKDAVDNAAIDDASKENDEHTT